MTYYETQNNLSNVASNIHLFVRVELEVILSQSFKNLLQAVRWSSSAVDLDII